MFCFFALIYGLYIKIGQKQSKLETDNISYNLNLEDGHQIIDIDLISDDRILFTIKNNSKIYAVIYDINSKEIKTIKQSND